MKTIYLILALLGISIGVQAQTLITLEGDNVSEPSGQFTLTAYLESEEDLLGIGYRVAVIGAGSGQFTLVDRDLGSTEFSFVDPADYRGPLDPVSQTDLGGLTFDFTTRPSGRYFLADYTFEVAPNTIPGDYTIAIVQSSGVNGAFEDTVITGSQQLVTIVPEPSAISLLLLSAGVMVGFIRKRH
jgi:hypothetical protein